VRYDSPAVPETLLQPLLTARHAVGNVWGALSAWCACEAARAGAPRVALVVPGPAEAQAAVQDLDTFGGAGFEPLLLPELEILEAPAATRLSDRLRALTAAREKPSSILVASIRAALEPAPPLDRVERARLERGGPFDLAPRLLDLGYERVPAVERPGEFAVRGGVVDLFPLGHDLPVRVELDGDAVESLRLFDVETQASMRPVDALDLVLTRLGAAGYDEEADDMLDALPDAVVLVADSPAIEERVRRFYDAPRHWVVRKERFFARAARRPGAILAPLPLPSPAINLDAGPPPRFHGGLARFAADLRAAGRAVVYAAAPEAERLRGLARDAGVECPEIRIGRLSKGFTLGGVAHLPHHEIFGRRPLDVPRRGGGRRSRPLDDVLELQSGDFVVHKLYGIGRFSGIERVKSGGREYDALVLGYHGGARLLVPAHDLSVVQKYVAPADAPLALSRLHTRGWTEAKQEAVEAAARLAKELVEVQARRGALGGTAFPPDDDLQRIFEASFPYEDTEDQAAAAAEIKRDLCAPRAMDRLVCGDVGFGKTELALRAAFRVAAAGRQTALLCPTTILAQQHYQTFRDRLAEYPMTVEMLSRFRSKRDQAAILRRLAAGEVDIVIGTHRLAQRDVRFKDLGLVIVDEEQRFGVEHKEALKRYRATVDVLTLTATPIPRTLHMALLTIRDISVLATAPVERLAVQTSVIPRDDARVRAAILHELERGGQAYFVHNRVRTIGRVADRLAALVPEARFAVGHGQMGADELEEAMLRFVSREADVLVATSIVENGIDIPNANTILIDDADRFGLSDLHQLRGRVGRTNRQAYALLLVPTDRAITPEAARRLAAIEELSGLGSGFKIAMRDMEIRGVGNILGREQHGHIRSVGYELYVEMLEREIARLQNRAVEELPEASVTVDLPAFVPEGYVPDLPSRVEFYRRLARARSEEEVGLLRAAARDRFGAMPSEVANLFELQRLRIALSRHRLLSLVEAAEYYVIRAGDRRRAEALAAADASRRLLRLVDPRTIYVPKEAGLAGVLSALKQNG
jgi:transcription-repair coupling factor (superfamily II helicase)